MVLFRRLGTGLTQVAKLKNPNDGLIQDGDENFYYFSQNKPPF
jgi:hypothetical protein